MSGIAGDGASSVAAYRYVISNALKACGVLVKIEPGDFLYMVSLQEQPLVVQAPAGWFSKGFMYLTSYKGLAFHCKSREKLELPHYAELIEARKMSIPDI